MLLVWGFHLENNYFKDFEQTSNMGQLIKVS